MNCDEPLANFVLKSWKLPAVMQSYALKVKHRAIAKYLISNKKKLDGVCDPFSHDGFDHPSQSLGGFSEELRQEDNPPTPDTPGENNLPRVG